MITKIVAISVLFIALIAFILTFIFDDTDPIGTRIFLSFCLGFVTFLIAGFIILGIVDTIAINKGDYITLENQLLKAIGIDEELHGSFFLGCGSIRSDESFIYISEVDEIGYKVQEIDIDKCYIIEENIEQPYLEIQKIQWRDWVVTDCVERYVFHIPPNSIKENYEVDINN